MTTDEPTLQQLFDLQGKVALVTGGSGYLGAAMARALAEAGARVIISSRNPERAEQAAAELTHVADGPHLGVQLDYLDESSLDAGFAQAVERAGRIDILVNNGHAALGNDWTTVTGEQFTRQLGIATGYFLLGRLLRNHLVRRQASGSILQIGSMYGVVGSYPETYAEICSASPVAYHALKGGIVQMTRHLAVYWAADNIRVNCLSPGPFPHPQVAPELVERLAQKSPLRRMGQAHELKGAVVFLASDASSYLTGHNLLIDGGWTAW